MTLWILIWILLNLLSTSKWIWMIMFWWRSYKLCCIDLMIINIHLFFSIFEQTTHITKSCYSYLIIHESLFFMLFSKFTHIWICCKFRGNLEVICRIICISIIAKSIIINPISINENLRLLIWIHIHLLLSHLIDSHSSISLLSFKQSICSIIPISHHRGMMLIVPLRIMNSLPCWRSE